MKRTVLPYLLCAALAALSGCSKDLVCSADQLVCGGACTSVQTDPKSCGKCGQACAAGQACQSGICTDCAATGTCDVVVYAACFDTNTVQGAGQDLAGLGAPLATDQGPIAFARSGTDLWVANSLNDTLSRIGFAGSRTIEDHAVTLFPSSAGFSDLEFLAEHSGLLYVSNSAAGTLVVVDPVKKAVVDEVPLALQPGEAVNPQGVGFVQNKAYVALQGANAVAVVEVSKEAACTHPTPSSPACGTLLPRIDLGPSSKAGANATPSRVLAFAQGVGATGKVYVTLSHLDPATYAPAPDSKDGKLAVIDPSLDAVSQVVTLTGCQDPADMALVGTTLWIACGFQAFGAPPPATGAGFISVDLSTQVPTVQTLVPTTQQPGALAICAGRAYAGDRASGALLRLDTAARTVTVGASPACPANAHGFAYVSAVACAP